MSVAHPSSSFIPDADLALLATEIRKFRINRHERPFEIKFLETGVTYDACGMFLGAYFDGHFFGTKAEWDNFCLQIEAQIEAKEEESIYIQRQIAEQIEKIRQQEMLAHDKPSIIKLEPRGSSLLEAIENQAIILEVNLEHPESKEFLKHYQSWRAETADDDNTEEKTVKAVVNFSSIEELALFASFLAAKSVNIVLLNHPNHFIGAHNGKLFRERELFIKATNSPSPVLDAVLGQGLFKTPSPLSMAPAPNSRKKHLLAAPFSMELKPTRQD